MNWYLDVRRAAWTFNWQLPLGTGSAGQAVAGLRRQRRDKIFLYGTIRYRTALKN